MPPRALAPSRRLTSHKRSALFTLSITVVACVQMLSPALEPGCGLLDLARSPSDQAKAQEPRRTSRREAPDWEFPITVEIPTSPSTSADSAAAAAATAAAAASAAAAAAAAAAA
jgi:hypothetical protein